MLPVLAVLPLLPQDSLLFCHPSEAHLAQFHPPPGDKPRRSPPGAERLPPQARLRPGHLGGLAGGRGSPGARAGESLLPKEQGVNQACAVCQPGVPEVLRVRVHGAGVPVPRCRVLPLRPHAESPDRAAAPGEDGQTHLCRG